MMTQQRAEQKPAWVSPTEFPFQSRWIAIDGHRTHYIDEGPRTTPVLLFVHPSIGWSFSYRKQVKELKSQFRCVAFDFPGFGLSKAAEGYKFTLSEEANVLARFVDILNLKNIIVWANDGGGPAAMLGLSKNPDRVAGLVVGGTFGWSLDDYPSIKRMIGLFSSRPFQAINTYTNLFARSISFALGARKLTKEERIHYLTPFKARETRNHALKLFKTFLDPAIGEMLNQSLEILRDKPILIQFGEDDAATKQKWPERWAKEFPNNRIVMLPKVKHFPFEDAPEDTTVNFLDWWENSNFFRRRPREEESPITS